MAKPLFWVDLEMTGLDEKVDTILEVAIIITDIDFKPLEEFHRIVFQPKEVLDRMNDWCKHTHGESGLTAAVPNGTPLETVEKEGSKTKLLLVFREGLADELISFFKIKKYTIIRQLEEL